MIKAPQRQQDWQAASHGPGSHINGNMQHTLLRVLIHRSTNSLLLVVVVLSEGLPVSGSVCVGAAAEALVLQQIESRMCRF